MRVETFPLQQPDSATHYGITNLSTFKIHLLRHNNRTMCTDKVPLLYIEKTESSDLPLCKKCPWQTP